MATYLHPRLAPLDGAEALLRVLGAPRYGNRVRIALLFVLEGLGYRRASSLAGLRDHRDVYRAAQRLRLIELHLQRKTERDAMHVTERQARAIERVMTRKATPRQMIEAFRVSCDRLGVIG